ncbi:MAG: hypothetical protein KAU48_00460, partial [Candidatus Thorarchaeota archaeon]|nr:hypothetical protein [Candidatus Thorarchaeota archaeon]
MKKDVLFLRLSYWFGAVIDAIVGVSMIFPDVFAMMEGFSTFTPGPDYTFAMGLGAPLMFGWTILLLWGDRKPVERREILLITVFPVIIGIYANRLAGLANGFVTLEGSLISLIVPIILVALFVGSYLYSVRNS